MVSKSNRDSLRAGEINESEYRQIVEKSQDIIFTLNPKMEFIYISPSFKKVLGYDSSDLIGRTFTSLIHPDDIDGTIKSIQRTVEEGYNNPNGIEYRVRHASGEWRWHNGNGTIVKDDKGQVIKLIGISRDVTDRIKMEVTLQENEEKYRLIVEKSVEIIFTLNEKGEFTYLSPSFEKVMGYEQTDFIGKSFLSIVHPDDAAVVWKGIQEDVTRGHNNKQSIEYRVSHKSGEWRWHHAMGSTTRDSNGKFISFSGIACDVTERKRAQDELKESEEKYRLIVENTRDIMFTLNLDEKLVYISPAIKKVLGFNPDEFIGHTFQSIVHPDDIPALRQAIQRNLREGYYTPDGLELRVHNSAKEWRWFNIIATQVRDEHGNPINYISIARDITERKKAEDALHESELRFRTLIEKAPVGIMLSRNGVLIYANEKLVELMRGQHPEVNIGRHVTDFVAPSAREESKERTRLRSLGIKVPESFESKLVRTDGSEFPVEIQVSQVQLADGIANIAFFTDISDRKKAEEEKQRIEEKAQIASRLAAVGEMAAGIAHEINNPLTGVIGISQMLVETEDLPETVKDDLKLIADSSQRVASIVKRLLTFARQSKPIRTSVDLNEIIDDTIKLREYVLQTANIEVVTRLDPELPSVIADSGQLHQVFLNLTVNAEQAMRQAHGHGTLTIRTQKMQNNIRITFTDDGPGITKENLGRLFEPLFTTKKAGEGTGLGLSLSRSIILEHEGQMSVESEFGHGATFIIDLPLKEDPPSSAETILPRVDKLPLTRKSGRILVVDDEPIVRILFEKTLRLAGYSLDTIADARIALNKIKTGEEYDVILLDIRIPGMSGTEFYAQIIEKAPVLKGKIIIITGDVMGLDVKAFLAQNNLPYLAKPLDINLLKEKIDTIINTN